MFLLKEVRFVILPFAVSGSNLLASRQENRVYIFSFKEKERERERDEFQPKFVILLGYDAEIDATTKRHSHLLSKCFPGHDVVFVTDLLNDLLLGETLFRLLGPEQIVNQDRFPHHLDLLSSAAE